MHRAARLRDSPYDRLGGVSRVGGLLLAKKALASTKKKSKKSKVVCADGTCKRWRGPQNGDVRAALAAAMREPRSGRQRRPTDKLLNNVINLPGKLQFTS